jgi:hypothetical protein
MMTILEALKQIAEQLDGLRLDDLTTAEHRIFTILRKTGVMMIDETDDIEWRAAMVKVSQNG